MRKGIADLHRRTRLSQTSNDRYLDALASVDTATPLGELVRKICAPTQWNSKRVRALRPWSPEDTALFRKLTAAGFPSYLDPKMTCNHIGNKKFCGNAESFIERVRAVPNKAVNQ